MGLYMNILFNMSKEYIYQFKGNNGAVHIDIYQQVWQVDGMLRKARLDAPGALHHT